MNRREQPYGIEWWIDLLFQADTKADKAYQSYKNHAFRQKDMAHQWLKRTDELEELKSWIHSRISDKYGEEK